MQCEGRVQHGVVVFESGEPPAHGTRVLIVPIENEPSSTGDVSAPATLADLFRGRVGLIHSGGAGRLSESGGRELAEHLEAKRRDGCL